MMSSPGIAGFTRPSALKSSFNSRAGQHLRRWLFNPVRWRLPLAIGICCVMLLGSLAASAQAPYVQAGSQAVGPSIDLQKQALSVSVRIVGVPFRLNYRSDAVAPKWRWSVYHAYDPAAGIFSPGDGRPRSATSLFGQLAKAPSWLSIGELAIAAQDGSELYVFDQRGDHLRTLNALTGALLYRFNYSAAGILTSIEDGYGNSTRIERDAAGLMTAVVAPHGQRTTFSSNAKGYPTRITDPLGKTISLDYAADGQLVAFTDARKNVYRFTADQQGRLTKLEDPAGGSVHLERSPSADGFKISSKTAMERESAYLFPRPSDVEASAVITDPAGSETHLQTGTDGNIKVTYSDGSRLTAAQQADPRWGLQSTLLKTLSVAAPSGLTSTVSVNRNAVLADSSDPLSMTTLTDTTSINGQNYTQIFDAKSRQITRLTPAGRRTITTLNEHGQVVKLEVPGLLPISLAYDAQGRLATFAQGTGAETRSGSLVYNTEGQVAAVTDALKRTTRFQYDSASRLSKQILPDGKEITLKSDANDNTNFIVPPGQSAHSFDYTPINLLKAYSPPLVEQGPRTSGSTNSLWNSIKSYLARLWSAIQFYLHKLFNQNTASPPHGEQGPGDTSYVYNNDGQLIKILRPDQLATEFVYDKGGRLSAVTGSGEWSFGYDAKTTKLTSITAPDGSALTYAYDGSLLTRAVWTGTIKGAVTFTYDNNLGTSSTSLNGERPVTLEYDSDGLLRRAGTLNLTRDGSTGLLMKSLQGNVTTTREYSGFGELRVLRASFKDQEILADRYERDALGRIVQKTETLEGQTRVYTYGYDSVGRLTDVTTNRAPTAHYDYDANSNRMVYVGPNGTLKASYDVQDRVNRYDKATYVYTGNGERLSKTVDGKSTTYSYDTFGNLKAASLPDGRKIDYVIDGANQRVGKKINGKLVQGFLYQDQLKVIAELDGQNQVVARFVYAIRSNVPDYMTKGGKTYRILTDHLGSPRIVIDTDSGVIAQRMDYDEFGNVIRDSNPGFQPFGFSGGLYDQDTKLVRFGRRDYDPYTAAWTAKDPMLFGADSTNLYQYCFGDPVNLIDPSGRITIGGGVNAGAAWGVGAGGSAIVTVDGHGNGGLVSTAAGTTGEGAFAGVGAEIQISNAQTVNDMAGPFHEAGVTGPVATGEIFWGDSPHGPVVGFSGALGPSLGAGLYGGITNSRVGAPDLIPDGLAHWWNCLNSNPSGCSGINNPIFGCMGSVRVPIGYSAMGPSPASGSGCGSGTGDIHFATLNGLRYDLQAVGEFVASQDPTGRVKIQIRLEPYYDSRSVSACTAVAALVDGVKVAVHLKPQPQVYLNGQPAQLVPGRGMRVGKAGGVTFTGDAWLISWPDGTGASIKSRGAYFDLIVQAGSSAGKLVGLLGKGGGDSRGDLVSRDGVVLATGFSTTELYGHFAESWRISQNDSLFHYAAGESTATFTDRSFPHQNVTVASLEPGARAEAERVCRAAGITAPAALRDCTLDFAVTGDRRFLSSAAFVQTVSREPPGSPAAAFKSGIQIVPADWGTPPWRWEVIKVGRPEEVVQAQDAAHATISLPPGEYQVATKPTQFDSLRVLWPQKLEVQTGQPVTLKLDSGVRFDVAPDLGPLWQWWLVRPEKPDQALQRQNGDQRLMLVPPGEYRVTTQPTQFDSQPVLWPQKIQVKLGQPVTFKASSGVRMIGPPGAGTGFEFQFLNDQKKTAQSGPQTWNTQALPPGTYTLQMRRQFGEWKTVVESIHVGDGQITEAHIAQLPAP